MARNGNFAGSKGEYLFRCARCSYYRIEMKVTIWGEELELLPEKAIWWKSRNILLMSDMHLGKVNHFRKAGIPVPPRASNRNWEVLIDLIRAKNPERLICTGDLFHSHYNFDWEMVRQFTSHFSQVSVELVSGNHDILSDQQYTRSRITVHKEGLRIGSFFLTHYPLEEGVPGTYTLSGHIHPGVQLLGRGRQAMTLPCFYFGEHQGLLPAFGMFTGLARIRPKRSDRIFAIADNSVYDVNLAEVNQDTGE